MQRAKVEAAVQCSRKHSQRSCYLRSNNSTQTSASICWNEQSYTTFSLTRHEGREGRTITQGGGARARVGRAREPRKKRGRNGGGCKTRPEAKQFQSGECVHLEWEDAMNTNNFAGRRRGSGVQDGPKSTYTSRNGTGVADR